MSEHYVQVKVVEGILRGRKETSEGISKNNINYIAFKGIPYAKPPVGNLRFKAPEPVEAWDGIRDALTDRNVSCQYENLFNYDKDTVAGDEDCLYLNVYTPELPDDSQNLKPVLFNIHGGGFISGNGGSETYAPDYFIEHGVVFVSPNYRCGALGFLSLQNDAISGNAGLKDQALALQWTHTNIRQFGGDAENITLIGISAGGASVEYLLLTELTKGLFKQAIIQSGSSLNTWAFNHDPRGSAVRFAQLLGYTGNIQDDKSLETFLLNCSAKDIVEISQREIGRNQKERFDIDFINAPCVEMEGKVQKFITRTPREILESGSFSKVPIIIGFTNNEGALYVWWSSKLEDDFALLNNKPEIVVPKNMNVPENKKAEVGKKIMQFYFKNQPVSMDNTDALIRMFGSVLCDVGTCEATNYFIQSSDKPVYCYGFCYETHCGLMKTLLREQRPDIEIKGVPHGGEIELMFNIKRNPQFASYCELSSTDRKYSKICTTLLTTFAKTGDPNYEGMDFSSWESSSTSETKYFQIGNEFKMVSGRLNEEKYQFWNSLYAEYGHLF